MIKLLMITSLRMVIFFVLTSILWVAIITSNPTVRSESLLIVKSKVGSPMLSQSRGVHTSASVDKAHKSKATSATLTSDELKDLKFVHKSTVNPQGQYSNPMFMAIGAAKGKIDGPSFHNGNYVVYDLETMMRSDGILVPYILGFTFARYDQETHKHNFTSFTHILPLKATNADVVTAVEYMMKMVSTYMCSDKDVYILAHNAAKFDMKVILNAILTIVNKNPHMVIERTTMDSSQDMYQLSIGYSNDCTMHFRDSYKLISASVDNIGKLFLKDDRKMMVSHNLLNLLLNSSKSSIYKWDEYWFQAFSMITDLKHFEKKYPTPIDYLKAYCMKDCEIVAKALAMFSANILKSQGLRLSMRQMMTISSTALKVWLNKYNNVRENPIMQINPNTPMSKWFKKAYVGGRTEVFHSGIGVGKVYHFDIPGMYALCMQKPLPIGNPVFVSNFKGEFGDLIAQLNEKGLIGFLKCSVKTPERLHIPVLPVKHSGKLTFPLGTFTGTWTTQELELAFNKGYLITPIDGYIFKAGFPLKQYSETFTNLKDASAIRGDLVTRNTAKLLLNTLYGKFASSYYESVSTICRADELAQLEGMYDITSIQESESKLFLVTYNRKPLADARSKFPTEMVQAAYNKYFIRTMDKATRMAIAASITSHGRVMLYGLYEEIIARGGVLCYSDTDSVFAHLPTSPFGLPFGPFIWDGKAEDNTYDKAVFLAPKMYYLVRESGNTTFKVKGVSTARRTPMSFEMALAALVDNTTLSFDNQLSFKSLKSDKAFLGLTMDENGKKNYNLFASPKRTWILEEGVYTTTPLVLTNEDINVLHTEVKPSYDMADIVGNMSHAIVKVADTDVIVKRDSVVKVNTSFNTITITIPMELINDVKSFKQVWMDLLAHTAANTNNLKDILNVTRLQILAWDEPRMTHKTLLTVPNSDWISFKYIDLMKLLIEKVAEGELEYDNQYIFDKVIIKLYLKTSPILVEDHNIEVVYNKAFLKVVDRKAEQAKLENIMLEARSKLKALQRDETIEDFKALEKELKTTYPAVEEFLEAIRKEIKLQLKDFKYDKFDMKVEDSILYSGVISAFKKTMVRNNMWTIHRFAENILDVFKVDRTDAYMVELCTHLSWRILLGLTMKEFLWSMNPTQVTKDTIKVRSGHQFYPANAEVMTWMSLKYVSGKISLMPKVVQLESATMTSIINKLNAQPVYMNFKYMKWVQDHILERMTEDHPEYEETLIKMDAITPFEKESMTIAVKHVSIMMDLIAKILMITKSQHIYFNYTHDFRGRIYPMMQAFSHISHKFMRPIFLLPTSPLTITELRDAFKGVKTTKKAENYLNILKDIKAPNKDWSLDRWLATITVLTDPEVIKGKFNYHNIARHIELNELMDNGQSITAPLQIDATCNVMQHMSVITGNVEVMKSVGLDVEIDSSRDKQELYIPNLQTIYKALAVEKALSLKQLRNKEVETPALASRIIKLLNEGRLGETLIRETPLITNAIIIVEEKYRVVINPSSTDKFIEHVNNAIARKVRESLEDIEAPAYTNTDLDRADFYTRVSIKMMNTLRAWTNDENIEKALEAESLIKLLDKESMQKALRNIVKKPAMTKAYAAKFLTAWKAIKEETIKIGVVLSNQQIRALTWAVIMALNATIGTELQVMKELQKAMKQIHKDFSWIMSPNSDFKVVMDNKSFKTVDKVFKHTINGVKKSIHTTIKVIETTQNIRKNMNSIFVNIIHSLDALHIGLLILENPYPMLPIHDAALLPIEADLNKVLEVVHLTFSDIHGGNKTFKSILFQISEYMSEKTLENLIKKLNRPRFRPTKLWTRSL